ncbi:MAG: DedA family protein [Planctomycetota bacterium]
MEFLRQGLEWILHIDRHLQELVTMCGGWTYGILFAIVFCETGLVVTPFLPGDSLLFAAGAIAAGGALDPGWLLALLSVAAIAGDTVNYWIGAAAGPGVFRKESGRFFRKEHLERTRRFFEKYGGKTIVIARFVPIVRTFAPFVAGVGRMAYGRFLLFNVTGGIAWVAVFVLGGYFFGNLPFVKRHFPLVILAIIVLSIFPAVIEVVRERRKSTVHRP